MVKKALVIVDAWEDLVAHDAATYPHLADEMKSFGGFLNEVCKIERKKGTRIIHSYAHYTTHSGPMKDIEIYPEDMVIPNANDIMAAIEADGDSIDELYWCGFHFGVCVHGQAEAGVGDKANIVTNLCLLFPIHSWKEMFASKQTFNYYLWSQKGFEEVNIS